LAKALDLLREDRKQDIWTKFCGFLDLSPDEFMYIQERLLLEQIQLVSKNEIGRYFFGDHPPRSLEEFRWKVPITTYENYEQFFGREDRSYPDLYSWAHTSGRSGKYKWIPYTELAYKKLGERVMAGVILASAREKGDVRIAEKDTLVYNTPPRPYISGISLHAVADQLNFRFIPPMEETESLNFQERIQVGFKIALRTGIDILGSMPVVLVKMGESFAQGAQSGGLSKDMLHPTILYRMIKGFIKSKMQGRPMLPRDMWDIKGLICGGTDMSIYRDKIIHYWGATPYDQFGSTEEGAMATHSWSKKDLTCIPDSVFFEFVPEEENAKWKRDPFYVPQTVLYNEVVPNKRYELIITNFFGKPLLRYRTYDIVTFTSLEDKELGIRLPQMSFIGRAMDFIDLAGWTGPIDERMVWQAIVNTGIKYIDWTVRKEIIDSDPYMKLYIEPAESIDAETIRLKVHGALKELSSDYADYEKMIGKQSLLVTILAKGSFQKYMAAKQKAGADLAHLKPAHMNASDENIEMLKRFSAENSN
jgi:hypothetical protein